MNEQLLIYGILHEAFTRTSYAPEPETADLLHLRFPYPFFCIAAFSLSGTYKAETDSYRRTLVSIIPKYTAGLAEFPTFFYRTENHEFLLLFNYPEEFEPDIYIKQSYEYFKQRHNCTVFWGISRPCVSLSEFIFAKKEALTALSFSLTDSHDDITVYSDQLFFTAGNADRSFSPGQMIAGQMLALHNAVTATFWSLNPVKYGFSEQLFAFQQEIISCQGDFEYYFSHLHDLCLSVSSVLAGQRVSKKKELVQETADFILQNYADANLNLSGTAQHFQVSEGYLSSIFKEYAGICFAEYLEKCRIEKSCVLLSDTASTIEQIAEDVGYNSVYSYRRAFKRLFHISPSAYREQKLP